MKKYLFVAVFVMTLFSAFCQSSTIDLNYVMGKFEPATHNDFVEIPLKYTDKSKRYLHKETLNAFIKMYNAALKAGHKITIISATRNFDYQKSIWEKKWRGVTKLESGKDASKIENPVERAMAILRYSSMPGTSRHHWGTDIDINKLENNYFEKGAGKNLYAWMKKHASSFGFCQVYSPKGIHRPNGYQEEKWHWSYMPLSSKVTDVAKKQLSNNKIQGFEGAETAVEIDMLHKYVLGTNIDCK
jgi:zinc D-Ala-D-Ala carboxypeptidase